MFSFAVKPCNKKAKPKESSSNLRQQIAEEDFVKIINVNLPNESIDGDVETYLCRMHIAVFADWIDFCPALSKRCTPVERVAWTLPASDLWIPDVRDTIAK